MSDLHLARGRPVEKSDLSDFSELHPSRTRMNRPSSGAGIQPLCPSLAGTLSRQTLSVALRVSFEARTGRTEFFKYFRHLQNDMQSFSVYEIRYPIGGSAKPSTTWPACLFNRVLCSRDVNGSVD